MADPDTTVPDRVISNPQAVAITRALYGAETSRIQNTEYSTSQVKDEYMLQSRAAYQTAMGLLTPEQGDPELADPGRETVRLVTWEAARTSLEFGIRNVKNMKLRARYFQEITDEIDDIRGQIGDATVQDLAELASRAMKVRDINLELYRAQLAPTSFGFKDWMQGKTLTDLQRIYTAKRFPEQQDFSALSAEDQMRVYGDIVEASGRSTAFATLLSDSTRFLKGGPFILLALGITVWQIAEDAHPVQMAVESALGFGASLVGAEVGGEIGAEIGAAGGPIGILVGGIIGGIIGAFAGGWASDHLFEATVGAFGGNETGPAQEPLYHTPLPYEFTLPDNAALTDSVLSQAGAGGG
ncbi:MAG TPA: hypothetical protein VFT45_17140 [Longimicrobium sp.]|nr:hypothetical protein [Longimicrobium sp.]